MMSYRVAWMQQADLHPSHEASMVKVFGTEMMQRLYNVAFNLLQQFGQLAPDELFSLDDICNPAIWGADHLVHSPAKRSKMGLLHIGSWHGAQLNRLFLIELVVPQG